MDDYPLLRLCGLWQHTSRAGMTYLTGRPGGVRVVAFKNTRKTKPEEPDFHLFLRQDDGNGKGATNDDVQS